MDDFDQNFREAQKSAEMMAQFAIMLWILAIVVAIAAAIWIYVDAQSRGKSGVAAALLTLLSAFYGIPCTLIVVCAWILLRPANTRQAVPNSRSHLPHELPSGIIAGPTASEFLDELEDTK